MSDDTESGNGPAIRESDIVRQAMRLGTATLHEASGQRGVLPIEIRPQTGSQPMAGRALTVRAPAGDNLWLHRAVSVAHPGDVLIAVVGGGYEFGYWGEILAWAARMRGVAGVVIDGCVRDTERLAEVGVPTFARGACVRGTAKDPAGDGALNLPITLGDVVVNSGDLVVGDGDGVLVVAAEQVLPTLRAGRAREDHEFTVITELRTGRSTMDIFDLPPLRAREAEASL
jgi:4-hydroxy-4-methyl-2-oxoglutarate aldolase